MFHSKFIAAIREDDLGLAVTGAGSWLGQALLAALAATDLLPRRLRLFGSHSRQIALGGRDVAVETLSGAPPLRGGPWLLLHYAALGKERTRDLATPDFLAANAAILHETFRIAQPASGLRWVFSSSGAVYGPGRRLIESATESPYGWCKVCQEHAIAEWCRERGVPLVIARIFNIGGPFVTKPESYALSSMLMSARRAGAIRIAATRPVFRSYVHVDELNGLLLTQALAQTPGEKVCFDTAGREIVEVGELAAGIAREFRPSDIQIARGDMTEEQPDWYVGEGCAYRTLLARLGARATELNDIIADTSAYVAMERCVADSA
jgi:nucleoside-diphosphate-sugar epimerase